MYSAGTGARISATLMLTESHLTLRLQYSRTNWNNCALATHTETRASVPGRDPSDAGNLQRKDDSMKCYVCAKEGKDSDAVAVCIACGMGTCMNHTIRKEVDVWEGSYPLPSKNSPEDAADALPGLQCSVR